MKPAVFWPARGTEDLVPPVKAPLCATPAAPYLVPALNEGMTYDPAFRGAAYGIVHRNGQALATFTVTEVAAGTKGLDQVLANTPGEPARVGALPVVWYRVGEHVGAGWMDDNRLVILIGEGAGATAEAVSAWLAAGGNDAEVVVPDPVPEVESDFEPALLAGLPVDDLPDGYTVLPINPLQFAASDAADSVTIHEDPVEAIGGGIVLDAQGAIVATVIGSRADPRGTKKPFIPGPGELPTDSGDGYELQSISEGGTSLLLVGADREAVEALTEAWRAALAR